MPEPREIHLETIARSPDIRLAPGFRLYLQEAAQFCLDHNAHSDGTPLGVEGLYRCNPRLRWTALQDIDRHTFSDTPEAAEHGAYGIAFVLILTLTEHSVIERSAKGPGFDFWLGERGDLGFQRSSRLEVSGILSNPAQLSSQTTKKIKQTMKSDSVGLPAYVVVVEFSRPASRIIKR